MQLGRKVAACLAMAALPTTLPSHSSFAAFDSSITSKECSIATGRDATGNVVICNFGYTLDNHIKKLKDRLAVLTEKAKADNQTPYQKNLIEKQIDYITAQLAEPQKSYDDFMHSIDILIGQIHDANSDVVAQKLTDAIAALKDDDIVLAQQRFAEIRTMMRPGVEQGKQEPIDTTARADFELGKIAFGALKWDDAKKELGLANTLVPFHEDYRMWYVKILTMLYDFQTSLALHQQDVERAKEISGANSVAVGRALNDVAGDQVNLGRIDDSQRTMEQALEIFTDVGYASGEAEVYSNLSLLLLSKGNSHVAEKDAELAVQLGEQSSDTSPDELARYYLNLSDIYIRTKGNDAAEILVRKAIKTLSQTQDSDGLIGSFYAFEHLSRIQLDEGHCDEARASLSIAASKISSNSNPLRTTLNHDEEFLPRCIPSSR